MGINEFLHNKRRPMDFILSGWMLLVAAPLLVCDFIRHPHDWDFDHFWTNFPAWLTSRTDSKN